MLVHDLSEPFRAVSCGHLITDRDRSQFFFSEDVSWQRHGFLSTDTNTTSVGYVVGFHHHMSTTEKKKLLRNVANEKSHGAIFSVLFQSLQTLSTSLTSRLLVPIPPPSGPHIYPPHNLSAPSSRHISHRVPL
ncbi:hypothetical protein CEXT_227531 [Caerostris extrusa]|uniref:Uncharacterized protein n=1 Tax=Caerostris extrusa TaxID=172846 RepID=A0AAV4WNR1_CAEEX|nr:hypothetical protein CEXT_227531 [Caerostris extrusa]